MLRTTYLHKFRIPLFVVTLTFMVLHLCACEKSSYLVMQGYTEGVFVYISSSRAGVLMKRPVKKGQQVKDGDLLFSLDNTVETAARDDAEYKLEQARAVLEDLKKGKRRSEIEAMQAQIGQAEAAQALAAKELARAEKLVGTSVLARQELDRARAAWAESQERVLQLKSELKTAKLGAREDQIMTAEAAVQSAEAILRKAAWDLDQTTQRARQDSLVFETIYHEGEWVPAGRPVLSLLPPRNIKVKAFVPEEMLSRVRIGMKAEARIDGLDESLPGTVAYVSPGAEYTPPVIFSRETRSKLVFMIEISFGEEIARKLHPGQPVDVKMEF